MAEHPHLLKIGRAKLELSKRRRTFEAAERALSRRGRLVRHAQRAIEALLASPDNPTAA